MLVSPWFLFRVESDSADVAGRIDHTGSATSSSHRGCRSSSGPASPTTSCSTSRSRAGCASRACSKRKSAGCSPIHGRALVENFVGQWLQLRNLETRVKPDFLTVPGLRRQPAQGFPARDGDAVRARAARGSPRARAHDGELHVRQRASRAALWDPGVYGDRFRRVESRTRIAAGCSATAASLSLTSVAEPHLADHSRQVHRDGVLEQPAAAAAGRRAGARGERAEGIGRRRSASSSSCTAPNPNCAACHNNIDPVGFALENFDADGCWRERLARGSRSTRPESWPTARPSTGRSRCARRCWPRPELFANTVTRENADLRARPRAWSPPICRWFVHREKCRQARLQS